MKKILIFGIFCFLSCKKNTSFDTEITEVKHYNPTKIIDTIFLNYRFGMSPKEFENHTLKLIDEKKLTLTGYYDFHFSIPSISYIRPQFNDNKLYELKIYLEFPENSNLNDTDLLFKSAALLYQKKYEITETMADLSYTYKEGNLLLEIQNNIYTPYISYTDTITLNKIHKEEKNKKEETQTDI